MTRVFSGVQPSGRLHLGNYLGAIRHFVPLQERYDALYCVVDLHAITTPQDPKALRAATLETTAAFLAAGLDDKRACLFNQSAVAAHAELAWMLSCVARLGWLERMTQFKDKAGPHRERESVGLYAYPVLMAADILAYKAEKVPVGEDQKQHLELARDIAHKFNTDLCGGEIYFPLPEPLIADDAARVMSLRDGTAKMSKSEASEASRIHLTDPADAIAAKVRRAKSDSEALPGAEALGADGRPSGAARAARPEAWNLLGLLRAAEGGTWEGVCERFGGQGFAPLKEALTLALVELVVPLGEETTRRLGDRAELERVLAQGATRARGLAEPVLAGAAKRMGLLR